MMRIHKDPSTRFAKHICDLSTAGRRILVKKFDVSFFVV